MKRLLVDPYEPKVKRVKPTRAMVSRYMHELGGGSDIQSVSQIAGLRAWYEARNTGFVYADGQQVGAVNDLSGNGNHLTQPTVASRPVYTANAGKPYLACAGLNIYLTRTGVQILNIVGANVGTVFCLSYQNSGAGGNNILYRHSVTDLFTLQYGHTSNTIFVVWGVNTNGVGRVIQTPIPGATVNSMVINEIVREPNLLSFYVDGNLIVSGAVTDSLNSATGAFDVGNGTTTGTSLLTAILFYNRVLTPFERSFVRKYLNALK